MRGATWTDRPTDCGESSTRPTSGWKRKAKWTKWSMMRERSTRWSRAAAMGPKRPGCGPYSERASTIWRGRMGCHHWESEHPHVFAEQARPTQSGDADNRLDVTGPTGVRSITPVSIPDARHIACASPAPRRDMCVESAAYHGRFRKTSQAHLSGASWSITTCRGRISAERRLLRIHTDAGKAALRRARGRPRASNGGSCRPNTTSW